MVNLVCGPASTPYGSKRNYKTPKHLRKYCNMRYLDKLITCWESKWLYSCLEKY